MDNRKEILTFRTVKDKQADRTYFFKAKTRFIYSYLSNALQELYNSVWSMYAFDQVNLNTFKESLWPIVSSGAVILAGNYTTKKMSQYYNESDEYDFFYQFLFAIAILSYSALHRVTDKKIETTAAFSLAVASEIMAIVYLYSASFQGSQFLLKNKTSIADNYALIMGLSVSGLAVPGLMAHLAKKVQHQLLKRDYKKGAQRSDTALIINGLTVVSNSFFQFHYYLLSEMTLSRIFQLTSIAHAILHYQILIKQFRDAPSFGVDVVPSIYSELQKQYKKIQYDYANNTKKHRVLRIIKNESVYLDIPRYQLRAGDLVQVEENMLSSMPVSGELIAFDKKPDAETFHAVPAKVSTNLIAHTGENVWIQCQTNNLNSEYKSVELDAVRNGRQAGVLVGSKVNLYGNENFFIQIKPEKEKVVKSGYQKKSVIEDIITKHKQKSVIYSAIFSMTAACLLTRDLVLVPAVTLKLLFHLFQMMIPFSETLLRKIVIQRVLKKINSNMEDEPIDANSALHLVDLCNAVSGYYDDLFQSGVAVVTDKTGTLTTSEMDVVGVWSLNEGVRNDVHQQAEWVAWIFTNQKKELEPEEFSFKKYIEDNLHDPHFLAIDTNGHNHLTKTITINNVKKEIETWHLGLYKKAGGKFTLVLDGEKKYLAFCGIPRPDVFHETRLLSDYSKMEPRTGVLTRDWCIASTDITEHAEDIFSALKVLFEKDDQASIEEMICKNEKLLNTFKLHFIFWTNNPLKIHAEVFVNKSRNIIPATGDGEPAAKNINDVLYPTHAGNSTVIRKQNQWNDDLIAYDKTIIFAGINDEILNLFDRILGASIDKRPVVIFCEMSTEGKGILASFLKRKNFFVIANGDGSNDIAMMREAHVTLAQKSAEGTYAPGVEQFADLNDRQLQKIFQTDKSFYESFDLFEPNSQFIKYISQLSVSLEKPMIALSAKMTKMSFELAKAFNLVVREMWQQHWIGVLHDVLWFSIAAREIIESTDRPMDNKHLCASHLSMQVQLAAFAIAAFEAILTYTLRGEATNIYCVVITLGFLPLALKSLFSAFGHVQEEQNTADAKEEKQPKKSSFRLFDRQESGVLPPPESKSTSVVRHRFQSTYRSSTTH